MESTEIWCLVGGILFVIFVLVGCLFFFCLFVCLLVLLLFFSSNYPPNEPETFLGVLILDAL